jgi:hypothetical protein
MPHSRRQLFANAAMAASRVPELACGLRDARTPNPIATRLDWRCGGLHDATDDDAPGEHVISSSFHSPEGREVEATRLSVR